MGRGKENHVYGPGCWHLHCSGDNQIVRTIYTIPVLLCFAVDFIEATRDHLLVLGQLYDCPSVKAASLANNTEYINNTALQLIVHTAFGAVDAPLASCMLVHFLEI